MPPEAVPQAGEKGTATDRAAVASEGARGHGEGGPSGRGASTSRLRSAGPLRPESWWEGPHRQEYPPAVDIRIG